jgi:hypothetical protein
MAMMVVLMRATGAEEALQPGVLAALGSLGVTTVSLVGDDRTLGVVIEGWAFDPRRSAGAAVSALGGGEVSRSILHPIAELAISPAPTLDGHPASEAVPPAHRASDRAAPE